MKYALVLMAFLASALTSNLAHADQTDQEKQTAHLLKILISDAKEIEYQYEGMILPNPSRGKDISDILANASLSSIDPQDGKVYVNNMKSECRDVTPKGLIGAQQLRCNISFISSEYLQGKNGLSLPKDASSSGVIIGFNAMRVVMPGAEIQLTDKKVSLALVASGI